MPRNNNCQDPHSKVGRLLCRKKYGSNSGSTTTLRGYIQDPAFFGGTNVKTIARTKGYSWTTVNQGKRRLTVDMACRLNNYPEQAGSDNIVCRFVWQNDMQPHWKSDESKVAMHCGDYPNDHSEQERNIPMPVTCQKKKRTKPSGSQLHQWMVSQYSIA